MDALSRSLLSALAGLCLLSAGPARAATSDEGGPVMQEVVPALSDETLVNPGMGIYLYGTLDPEALPTDAWFSKIITIGYFRDDWSRLAPDAEGEYRFDEYFGPIFDLWVEQWGKRVAFRFMSQNMHSRQKYVTPKWAFDKGVPGVLHKGLYTDEQIDPAFWDERYLDIQERFIADLGRYLDERPGLEFVDIGSIGEWGEMHLARWTSEQLAQTDYTDEKYIAAYRRIIDAFARAFPRTRVFLNVGDYQAINDYAAIRGLHFRQDGLTPSGPSYDVGKRFYHPYSRRGVVCNYEFHSGYEEMQRKGWGIRETFENGLSDPISYLHINLTSYWQLRDPPTELREAIADASGRIGFRFVLSRLRCNQAIRLDGLNPGRLVLEHTWRNTGVAPCYDSYALRWSLVDASGKVAAQWLSFPRRPTTLWWPGEEVALRDLMSIPADTPLGTYRLSVEMVKPEQPGLQVQLGIAGRDAEGRYDIAQVMAERLKRRPMAVYQESFRNGVGGWSAAEGMTARVEADDRGGPALVLEGRQPGISWNYAAVRVPVRPYSRYRLTCWMRVDKMDPAAPPYMKMGVNDGAGKWITNLNTDHYDLDRVGTWQRLSVEADTPAMAASADLAIEKGFLERPATATIWVRDVALELLETP